MMTQSRGIPADKGRRSKEPGSGNEQSGSRLALSHEQTKSKGRQRKRSRKLRDKKEVNCREQRSRADLQSKGSIEQTKPERVRESVNSREGLRGSSNSSVYTYQVLSTTLDSYH